MPLLHMETDAVRATGHALLSFVAESGQTANALRQLTSNLTGVWLGPSSDQFTSEARPLLDRLNTLAESGAVLQDRLLHEVEEWERVDSRFGDSVTGGTMPARGDNQPGEGVVEPQVPPGMGITGDYNLDSLLDYDPPYSGGLGDVMADMQEHLRQCVQGECPDSDLYRQMAEATGLTEADCREQFDRVVENIQAAGPPYEENPALDPLGLAHQNHWGSRRQLLFGKVVGDHLGIHPVFASLLRPDGGLIGPSDSALTTVLDGQLSGIFDENAWDYHGAAHDAFGYLHQHQDIGPGYQYLPDAPKLLDTDSPLSGQLAGYLYWAKKVGISNTVIETSIRTSIYAPQLRGISAFLDAI